MKITCPKCRSLVPASRCNVDTNVAVCDRCSEAFTISSLVATGKAAHDFDIHDPPRGAWFADTGNGWQLGASTRSAMAFFLVPILCVWSGGSLGGLYGSQIINGEFNLLMSIFGIPFFLGTLFLGSIALMSICGHVLVTVEDDVGRLFVGIGPIGWTRRFRWSSITAVEEQTATQNQSSKVLALVGQRRLQFGTMLSDPRRYYLLQCLRQLLGQRSHHVTAFRAGEPKAW